MVHFLVIAGIEVWITVAILLAVAVPAFIQSDPKWCSLAQRWPAAVCAQFAVTTVSWPILFAFTLVMKLTERTHE